MNYTWMVMMAAGALAAQQLDLTPLDRLAARAKESANVNLDADKLRLAAGLLSSDKPEANARNLVGALKGVFVRTFEFERTGEYSRSDVDAVRSQLSGPYWNRIVDVRGKDETVEVWFYMENGKMGGLAVISAEPKELAVVNVVGPLDTNALAALGGSLGIPSIGAGFLGGGKTGASPKSKKQDE